MGFVLWKIQKNQFLEPTLKKTYEKNNQRRYQTGSFRFI